MASSPPEDPNKQIQQQLNRIAHDLLAEMDVKPELDRFHFLDYIMEYELLMETLPRELFTVQEKRLFQLFDIFKTRFPIDGQIAGAVPDSTSSTKKKTPKVKPLIKPRWNASTKTPKK